MRQQVSIVLALLLATVACQRPAELVHPSYETLTRFLAQENVYQTLDISEVNVDRRTLVESKDYRPDNETLRYRHLEATYECTLTTRDRATRDRVYQAKAAIVSADSIHWRMKSLVIQGKVDSANTVTETTYQWLPDGPKGKRTTLKRLIRTEV